MSKQNISMIKSFKCAVEGIINVVKSERNMRIHISVSILIFFFAYLYEIDKIEWISLIITVFLVVVAETINTAIEYAVDTATKEYNNTAKMAKDIAAGAVMMSSVLAVIIGVFLFGNVERIIKVLTLIIATPFYFWVFIAIVAIEIAFITLIGRKK